MAQKSLYDCLHNYPIIAGRLISNKDDVVTALSSGAVAILSTNSNVWFC